MELRWTIVFCFVSQNVFCLAVNTDLQDEVRAVRKKRGIGSVIVFGTSVLLRTTTLGVTVAQAITDGCGTQPSICTNKDLMKTLETEIKEKKNKFDRIYSTMGNTIVDLRQSTVNNDIIIYKMNEYLDMMAEIRNLTDQIFPFIDINDYLKNNASIKTDEAYLGIVVGQSEYILKTYKEDAGDDMSEVVLKSFAETLVGKFLDAYSSVENSPALRVTGTQPQLNDMFSVRVSNMPYFKSSILFQKMLMEIGKNAKSFFTQGMVSYAKWRNPNNWLKLKTTLIPEITKFVKNVNLIKNYIKTSTTTISKMKTFNLNWSQRISSALGIIGDIITIALEQRNWKKVADEMEAAKRKYADYNNTLTIELAKLESNLTSVDNGLIASIASFKDISGSIKELFSDVFKNGDFVSALGLSSTSVGNLSPSVPDVNNVDKENLLMKQEIMISFMNAKHTELESAKDLLVARRIINNLIFERIGRPDAISDIKQALIGIFNSYSSSTIQKFTTKITTKQIVCTVAEMFPLKSEYDFYPLTLFREKSCIFSDSEFNDILSMTQERQLKLILLTVVKRMISENPQLELENLHSIVKNSYLYSGNDNLREYGKTIDEKSIVCTVAEEFPAMQYYDGFQLDNLRNNCFSMSPEDFRVLKEKATKLKELRAEVKQVMELCETYNVCLCPSAIQQTTGANRDDVISAIKDVRRTLVQYCGNDCPCVSL